MAVQSTVAIVEWTRPLRNVPHDQAPMCTRPSTKAARNTQALAAEDADFDLGHVQPTGVLWGVVELNASRCGRSSIRTTCDFGALRTTDRAHRPCPSNSRITPTIVRTHPGKRLTIRGQPLGASRQAAARLDCM